MIDRTAFPDTPAEPFWTSSTFANGASWPGTCGSIRATGFTAGSSSRFAFAASSDGDVPGITMGCARSGSRRRRCGSRGCRRLGPGETCPRCRCRRSRRAPPGTRSRSGRRSRRKDRRTARTSPRSTPPALRPVELTPASRAQPRPFRRARCWRRPSRPSAPTGIVAVGDQIETARVGSAEPHGYSRCSSPPAAAYSHSASLGRKPPSQMQNAYASYQSTQLIGNVSFGPPHRSRFRRTVRSSAGSPIGRRRRQLDGVCCDPSPARTPGAASASPGRRSGAMCFPEPAAGTHPARWPPRTAETVPTVTRYLSRRNPLTDAGSLSPVGPPPSLAYVR